MSEAMRTAPSIKQYSTYIYLKHLYEHWSYSPIRVDVECPRDIRQQARRRGVDHLHSN